MDNWRNNNTHTQSARVNHSSPNKICTTKKWYTKKKPNKKECNAVKPHLLSIFFSCLCCHLLLLWKKILFLKLKFSFFLSYSIQFNPMLLLFIHYGGKLQWKKNQIAIVCYVFNQPSDKYIVFMDIHHSPPPPPIINSLLSLLSVIISNQQVVFFKYEFFFVMKKKKK